jgi:hypothetical protein
VVSFDGKGVPLMKAEVVKLKAKLGTGEKRQQKKEALVEVSYTVEDKPRATEALAELLVDPEAARARRQRDAVGDDAPRAQQVRRPASLVRTKQEGLECIKADAERREPQHRKPLVVLFDGALGLWRLAPKLFREWRRVTCAGPHARRRRPLECGQRLVRGRLQGWNTSGAGEADGNSTRPGRIRYRRTTTDPHQAEQLSWLSRGNLVESHLLRLPGGLMFHHGMENRQQLAHTSGQGDFRQLSGGPEALITGLEHRMIADDHQGAPL